MAEPEIDAQRSPEDRMAWIRAGRKAQTPEETEAKRARLMAQLEGRVA